MDDIRFFNRVLTVAEIALLASKRGYLVQSTSGPSAKVFNGGPIRKQIVRQSWRSNLMEYIGDFTLGAAITFTFNTFGSNRALIALL